MKVQILGSGCARCTTLDARVRALNEKHQLHLDIEKVTDLQQILKFRILATPGLVIDGVVKSAGTVPGEKQLLTWFCGESK